MLPSKGYFTNNRCLFYDAGVCDRPYCHYRHAKKGQVTDEGRECIEQSIKSIEDRFQIKIDHAKELTEKVIVQLDYPKIKGESVEAASKATYKPTPINILRQNEAGTSSSSSHRHIPIQNTLIYRPPIRSTKLSHQNLCLTSTFGFGSYQPYSPTSLSSSSKAPKPEYVPTSKSSNGSVSIEYDPTKYVPIPVDSSIDRTKKYVPTSSEVPRKKTTEQYVPIQIKSKNNNDTEPVDYNPTEISTIIANSNADTHYSPESNLNNEQQPLVDYTPSVIEGDQEPPPKKLTAQVDLEDDLDFINDILDDDNVHVGQKDQKKLVPKLHLKITPDKNVLDKENSKRKKQSSNHHHSSSKHSEEKSSKSKSKNEKLKSTSSKSKSHSSSKESSKFKSHQDKSKTDKSSSKKSDHKSSKHRSKSSHSKESLKEHHHQQKKDKEKEVSKKSSKSSSAIRKSSSDTPKSNNINDQKETTPKDSKTMFFIPQEDMFSEDDIEAQCRKIFEDNPKSPTAIKATKRPLEESSEEIEIGRKRVAHSNQINSYSSARATLRPNFQMESSKMLIERYKLNNCKVGEQGRTSGSTSTSNQATCNKVRIAHVPNVNKLISSKTKITTTKKNIVEKARDRLKNKTAQEILTDRPTCKDPENTKIPYHIRSLILNNMIDACLDMYLYPESAYQRAKTEEYTVFDKCRSLAVYKSSAKLAVHRLQVQAKRGVILDDPLSTTNNNKKEQEKNLKENNLYNQIKKWVLSESELRDHGFPQAHPDSSLLGAAIINSRQKATIHKEIDEKVCCRCHKVYKIDEFGFQLHPEECIYHYKRRYRFRGESKYGCCSGTDEYGCTSAPCHVNDELDTDNLRGYVKTIDTSDLLDNNKEEQEGEDYGIYALDCEMSYTTAGIELTRITVIDRKCQVVYETIVKPFHPIIDYNTRFSGIEPSHMEGVTTTLLHVQANLLHMFNSKTILIGHSLESDFKALKLIHNTVIDTSVMFPHKMGLPFKKALKTLAYDFLKKIIQNQISGHDSAEDAITCMELVLWKVNEDIKLGCCS